MGRLKGRKVKRGRVRVGRDSLKDIVKELDVKFTRFLTPEDIHNLQFEVVSQELKVYLTRLLYQKIKDEDTEVEILRKNNTINKSRNLLGLPIYVLEADGHGYYEPAEHAWHNGEFELVFRRLNTVQFIEFLCELIEEGVFSLDQVNGLLERDSLSFRVIERPSRNGDQEASLTVDVLPTESLETLSNVDDHPNMRLLVSRMQNLLEHQDYTGVLHASASIFETIAKQIVAIPTVQNQTLGSFFQRYRTDSRLPDAILDYILDVYNRRNSTPLAGHGSTMSPNISREEAVFLSEMTKAFIRIEYTLQINARPTT